MRRSGLAKNQHYVPRFILKHFTEHKEQIWVFDKQTKRKFKTNIKNVAAERGFYNFELNDNNEVTLEPALSEIEGHVSSIFKKIIRNESIAIINDSERSHLSSFFSLQFVRTPQWRNMCDNMHERISQSIENRGWNIENIEGFEARSDEASKLEHMRYVYKYNEFAPDFFNKTWVLLKTSKKKPFWISDNPISLQNMNTFGPYGNIGLQVKGIEIYFPISKTLSIGMWCPSLKDESNKLYEKYSVIKRSTPWMVGQITDNPLYLEQLKAGIDTGCPIPSQSENIINHNYLQVKYSSRFVFSSNNDFSLLEEIIETHPGMRKGPEVKVN